MLDGRSPADRAGADALEQRCWSELTEPPSSSTVNQVVRFQVLDRAFSALADPTRRDILDRLASGPASVTELARPYGISLPGVMKHVRVLEAANLVTTHKQGRVRECRLGQTGIDEVTGWIERHRRQWEGRLDRLGAVIERRMAATE
jgi:DNA-binding transcriptional ArsR family regulator